MIDSFTTEELRKLLRPIVYEVKLGKEVIYVGASAYGIGRPLNCSHKIYKMIVTYQLPVTLDVTYFDSASEAFNVEIGLIKQLKPRFNNQPDAEIEWFLRERQKRSREN